jgi:TatA/E family protein of Tat protein translocase
MFRNPSADVILVLVVVLLFFGPKRLPSLGRSLREFKDGLTSGSDGKSDEEHEQLGAGDAPGTGAPQVGEERVGAEQVGAERRS